MAVSVSDEGTGVGREHFAPGQQARRREAGRDGGPSTTSGAGVTVGGVLVELTATEYELVRPLSLDAGRVVTFETLLRRIWPKRENADANVVRNFVKNLRRKLDDNAASPACLFNERGFGYRMAKPPER